MVLDTDKNIWDMIELAIRVICILVHVVLVDLMLICKTKYREAVRLVRYVHVFNSSCEIGVNSGIKIISPYIPKLFFFKMFVVDLNGNELNFDSVTAWLL